MVVFSTYWLLRVYSYNTVLAVLLVLSFFSKLYNYYSFLCVIRFRLKNILVYVNSRKQNLGLKIIQFVKMSYPSGKKFNGDGTM